MKFEINSIADTQAILVQGRLCEKAEKELPLVAQAVIAPKVIFHCEGITSINSYGAALWIKFIKSLPAKAILYVRCSEEFTSYAAMLPSFYRPGRVLSFFTAYFCPQCDTSSSTLIDLGSSEGQPDLAAHCTKCNALMRCEEDLEDLLKKFKNP